MPAQHDGAADFGPDQRVEALLAHCLAITASLEMDEVGASITNAVAGAVPDARCMLCLAEEGAIRVVAAEPPCATDRLADMVPSVDRLAAEAVARGIVVHSGNLAADPRIAWGTHPTGSLLAVPLVASDTALGVLIVMSPRLEAFSPADGARLLALAPVAAAAVRRAVSVARERRTRRLQRQLDGQKGLFLSLMSRELREPLAAMTEICGALRNGAPNTELAHQLLAQGHAVSELVEKVLAMVVGPNHTMGQG